MYFLRTLSFRDVVCALKATSRAWHFASATTFVAMH